MAKRVRHRLFADSACLLGLSIVLALASRLTADDNGRLWLDGVWDIEQQVVDRVGEALRSRPPQQWPSQALVVVRTGPDCKWLLASLTETRLVRILQEHCGATLPEHSITFSSADDERSAEPAEFSVDLEIAELVRQGSTEELTCRLSITGSEPVDLTARCGLGHRNWFVKPRSIHWVWVLSSSGLGIFGSFFLGRGAWQTFARKYAGARSMWTGAVMLLTGFGFLWICWIASPDTPQVQVLSQDVDIVLEATDSLLFPDSSQDTNRLAQFMRASAVELSDRLGKTDNPREASFWQWFYREFLEPPNSKNNVAQITVDNSKTVTIYKTSVEDCVALKPISERDIENSLPCGRLGRESRFVVPWSVPVDTARPRLVVLLTSGNVGSAEEAQTFVKRLREYALVKPAAMQVFTAMLPTVPRSGDEFEMESQRFRRLCAVSDWIVPVYTSANLTPPPGCQCQVRQLDSWLPCSFPENKKDHDYWNTPRDLDAERQEYLAKVGEQHVQETAESLALAIDGIARDDMAIFRLNRNLVIALLGIAGLLLLFLCLQDELTKLQRGYRSPRFGLTARLAVLTLAFAFLLCLLFLTRETSRFATRGDCELAIWGVAWLGYCSLWFPYVVGRMAGDLTSSETQISNLPIFHFVLVATVLVASALVLGVGLRSIMGQPVSLSLSEGIAGAGCWGLILAIGLALLGLNGYFVFYRFARGHRMAIALVGELAAVILLLLPFLSAWTGPTLWLHLPLPLWLGLAAFGVSWVVAKVAYVAPKRDAMTHLRQEEICQSLEWGGLAFAVLAPCAVFGLVRGAILASPQIHGSPLGQFFWEICGQDYGRICAASWGGAGMILLAGIAITSNWKRAAD